MGSPSIIPCIEIKPAKPLQIRLPFGGALQSFANFAEGPPTQCALIHSLMLQLMPALGGMACLLKVLKVIKTLGSAPPDFFQVAKAVTDMLECFNVFAQIPCMIADILRILIAYLKCFIEAVKSILNFQVGIDLNAAEGNPVMLASLTCAQDNAQTSMQQLMEALGAIEPLMEMLKPIMDIGGVGVTLPSFAKMAGEKDPTKALDQLEGTLQKLQDIVDMLPC